MKRVLRWLWVAAAVVSTLVAAVLVVQHAVLPPVIEGRVVALAREYGLDLSAKVRSVSLSGVELTDLRLGDDGPTCGRVRVNYRLADLFEKRLGPIEVQALTVPVSYGAGGLSLGPPADFAPASEKDGDGEGWSVERIVVGSSDVRIAAFGETAVFPIRLDARPTPRGWTAEAELHSTPLATPIGPVHGHVTASVEPGAEGACSASLTVRGGRLGALNVERLTMDAAPEDEGTGWRIRVGGSGPDWALVDVEASVGRERWELDAGRVRYGGHRAERVHGEGTYARRDLSLRARSVSTADEAVTLREVTVAGAWEASPFQLTGDVEAGAVDALDERWPGVTGRFTVGADGSALEATWSVQAPLVLHVEARWPGEATGSGGLRFWLPETTLEDSGALARLLPQLEGVGFTGRIGIEGSLAGSTRRVTVAVSGGHVTLAERDAEITGLGGEVTIDRFSPLKTAARQRLTAETLRLGKWQATDATLDFQIERLRSILIERVSLDWGGGQVFSTAFRVDAQDPALELMLFFDGLSLEQVLERVGREKVSGTGQLYGRLPLTIDWPRIRFGEGFVYAGPEGGTLSVEDPALVEQTLEQQQELEGQEYSQIVKQRILEALKSFHYNTLRLDLTRGQGGLISRIELSGRGRRGAKQEIASLVFNLSGVEEVLNWYLGLTR